VQVIEKQQRFALLDVPKLDAIGKAGARVGNQALHAEALQFVVGKSVEATEGRGVETRNLERHGGFPCERLCSSKFACGAEIRLPVPCFRSR
jgi:hypothetical protein